MIKAQIPDSGDVAVVYPATLTNYASSVTAGITDTKNKIQSYVSACGSKSRIVLVGLSQGGQVMTDTLVGGVDKPAPLDSSYKKYITAVTVFGDPTFTANQSFNRGTSTKDGVFRRAENGASLALLKTYASVLRSYCDADDEVCASGDSLSVHSAEVGSHAKEATAFVVGKV